MSVLFDDESLPASARIKQCVMKIDEDLKKLAELAERGNHSTSGTLPRRRENPRDPLVGRTELFRPFHSPCLGA